MSEIVHIKNIAGLTSQIVDNERVVRYHGEICPEIATEVNVCEHDTSFKGDIIDSWATYQTPIGVVKRHYYARGASLERSGVKWTLIEQEAIADAQSEYNRTLNAFKDAEEKLRMLVAK